MIEVNVTRFAARLDELVAQGRNTTGIGVQAVLERAGQLLEKIREAPIAAPDPQSSSTANWHAIADTADVICWREGVRSSLYGSWVDDRVSLLELTVGESVWGMWVTPNGASSYCGTGEGIDNPADRRRFEEVKRREVESRRRMARAVKARANICPRCSWVNAPDDSRCAFCGVAGVPWPQSARVGELPSPATTYTNVPTEELTSEAAVQQTLPFPSAATVSFPAMPQTPQPATHDVRGDVVINGLRSDRKAHVAQAAADACERAGLGRPPVPWLVAQLERPPMLLCRNVTAAQAADIQRRLVDAGASTSFEVSHD